MPWRIEIHHIDLITKGDSTLIRVIETAPLAGAVARQRNVLIDGGLFTARNRVNNYLLGLGIANVQAVVATHYDEDHFNGVRGILQIGTARYDNSFIFDQGHPGPPSDPYTRYIQAIGARGNRLRVTEKVLSTGPPTALMLAGGWLHPSWLLNKDILWCRPQRYDAFGNYYPYGNYQLGAMGGVALLPLAQRYNAAAAPNNADWDTNGDPRDLAGNVLIPAGAPTLRCIAVNQYIRGAGAANPVSGGIGADPKNEKSLAFVLEYNNFRYYIGGDIETAQENFIGPNLNATDDIPGRVLAMKASHHGANTATSKAFINRMRPSAVVISCGTGNQHGHPAEVTVNILDGYPEVPILGDLANANWHPPEPPSPPFLPVENYLTGYHVTNSNNANPPLTFGGNASVTAGNPYKAPIPGGAPAVPRVDGHIRLEVSDVQSNVPVEGEIYRGVMAAANAVNANTGLGLAAAVITQIADVAATHGLLTAVARAIGATPAQVTAALDGAAYAGDDATGPGLVSAAIAAAAGGGVGAAGVAVAAANGVMGAMGAPRVISIGAGAGEAIGHAVVGDIALNITQAATHVGANAVGAQAAGQVGNTLYNFAGPNPLAAGYAAAAALKAGMAGAALAHAAIMAACIGAQVTAQTAANTATMIANVAAFSGLPNNQAAFIGAVAAATYYEGVPIEMNAAVSAALNARGFGGVAAAAGIAAQAAATIPNNTLFSMHFNTIQPGVAPPINHVS